MTQMKNAINSKMVFGANTDVLVKSGEQREQLSHAEEKLRYFFNNNCLIEYGFETHYLIGNYIADFYCKQLKLAIMVEKNIHSLSIQKEKVRAQRDQTLNEQYGIKVQYITSNKIMTDFEKVKYELALMCIHRARDLNVSPIF